MANYKNTLEFIESSDEKTADEDLLKYRLLLSRHRAIEHKLSTGWTHKKFVAQLNKTGMNISLDTFRTYLYRMRKEANGIDRKAYFKHTPAPERSTDKSNSIKNKEHIIEEADRNWNKTEKLIGYQLEDCIRPYVLVEDGTIVKNFPKGTILHVEIRNALTRLQNKVHPS